MVDTVPIESYTGSDPRLEALSELLTTEEEKIMRTFRTLGLALATLVSLSSFVAAANEMKPPAAPVNATFQRMKALVGTWSGGATGTTTVTYTLVSDGSALMERLQPAGEPEMISMYAPDGDGVMMTHYCSMHNQPRMRAAASATGPIEFAFVDATNLAKPTDPHMDHVKLSFGDPGKFSEEWSFRTGDDMKTALFAYTKSK